MISAFRWLAIALYTFLLGPPACLVGLVDRGGEGSLRIARLWIRMILATCRVEIRTTGLDAIDPNENFVVMSNHRSTADVAVLLAALPLPLRFMAKRELGRIPLFGWAMSLGGHLLVDRGNRTLVRQSLDRGVDLIRSGRCLVVFPEGSRSAVGELGSFKSGGFQMALEAGVPILPVSLIGSDRIAQRGTWEICAGEVRVVCGEPIATSQLDPGDRALLKQRVREAILRGLEEGGERLERP